MKSNDRTIKQWFLPPTIYFPVSLRHIFIYYKYYCFLSLLYMFQLRLTYYYRLVL